MLYAILTDGCSSSASLRAVFIVPGHFMNKMMAMATTCEIFEPGSASWFGLDRLTFIKCAQQRRRPTCTYMKIRTSNNIVKGPVNKGTPRPAVMMIIRTFIWVVSSPRKGCSVSCVRQETVNTTLASLHTLKRL